MVFDLFYSSLGPYGALNTESIKLAASSYTLWPELYVSSHSSRADSSKDDRGCSLSWRL